MDSWKEFEIEWTEFLKKTYGDVAYFQHMGEEDSTKPDILVKTKKGHTFYIETKKCPAQCGQFVLYPDVQSKKFIFSEKNDTKINEFAETIIHFMNYHFESFKEAGTAGRTIEFDNMEEVFCNWIMKTYGDKDVELVATNNRIMIRLEDFPKYFNVTAKYRIKRSGSDKVGHSRISAVKKYIEENYITDSNRTTIDGALFYKSSKNLHNQRFTIDKYEYMFSFRNDEFEIRKLSNTFNANVIFSITLKYGIGKGMSDEEIKKYLTSK